MLGSAAVIYDVSATIASVVFFGWLLMLAGVMQIVHAFQVRTWSGFFIYLLDGILRATVGTLMVVYPGAGAEALTLVLSIYFIVGGLFKTFGSIVLQFPSWGWSVASGLVSGRTHSSDPINCKSWSRNRLTSVALRVNVARTCSPSGLATR